jgi:hypothetical protein
MIFNIPFSREKLTGINLQSNCITELSEFADCALINKQYEHILPVAFYYHPGQTLLLEKSSSNDSTSSLTLLCFLALFFTFFSMLCFSN